MRGRHQGTIKPHIECLLVHRYLGPPREHVGHFGGSKGDPDSDSDSNSNEGTDHDRSGFGSTSDGGVWHGEQLVGEGLRFCKGVCLWFVNPWVRIARWCKCLVLTEE